MLTTTAKNPGLLRRAWLKVRAWNLRWLIASAEEDITYHEALAELAPRAAAIRRQYRDELQVMLIDCELGRRTS